MCHIGYLSHLYSTTYIQGWYLFTGIYLPLESKHLPVGCIHAYLRVVHPGVTLAFRVMLNGMTKVAIPLLASSSSLGRPIGAPRAF